jgi:mediator of RNA polymerase II transcription subunit 13
VGGLHRGSSVYKNKCSFTDNCESTSHEKGLILQEPEPDENAEIPTIVVYMVDPFTYGNDWDELSRLSTLGMLRCYQEMVESLPESMRDHVQLQVRVC